MISKKNIKLLNQTMTLFIKTCKKLEDVLISNDDDELCDCLYELHGAMDYLSDIDSRFKRRYMNEFGYSYEDTCIYSEDY